MKPEIQMFNVIAGFFLLVGIIYGVVTDWTEWVGVIALILCAGLGAMIGFYLWMVARKLPLRPEDDLDGEIEQQAGYYGAFTPYSWWPLWLGIASALIFLGTAVAWWIIAFGALFGVFAVVGWVYESFHGEHAR